MFVNSSYKNIFQQQGFVVLPLLDVEDIQSLEKLYENTSDLAQVGLPFYTSIWSPNAEYRKLIHEKVNSILFSRAVKYLSDIEPIFSNFHIKKSRSDSSLIPHQDWNFVNEPHHESITVWCPLTDTDENNGALQVIPKSHCINNYIRGRFFDAPFKDIRDTVVKEKLVSIPMKAGEAIFFHSRLIHASSPNLSGETRIAASVVVVPKGTPLIHDVLDLKTSLVKRLNVTPDFFYKYSCFDGLSELTGTEEYPYRYTAISEKELESLLRL